MCEREREREREKEREEKERERLEKMQRDNLPTYRLTRNLLLAHYYLRLSLRFMQ